MKHRKLIVGDLVKVIDHNSEEFQNVGILVEIFPTTIGNTSLFVHKIIVKNDSKRYLNFEQLAFVSRVSDEELLTHSNPLVRNIILKEPSHVEGRRL